MNEVLPKGEWMSGCETRLSENDGRSDVTDSLECPDDFRLP